MQIAIPIFPGFTALDVIGSYQVFTNLPGTDVALCATEAGIVTDDIGLVRLGVHRHVAAHRGGPAWWRPSPPRTGSPTTHPQPPFDAGSPSKAPPHIHELVSELLHAAQAEILDIPLRRTA